MEKGQILEFTIEDMSQEGKGIGKADGFACGGAAGRGGISLGCGARVMRCPLDRSG